MRQISLHHGFTLIETIIAMGLSVVVILAVTMFNADVSRSSVLLGDRLEMEREVEVTFRTLLTEIRSMGPAENGSYPIATATETTLSFFTDVDNDGIFEQVRYFLSGTTLMKGITEPTGSPATYPSADEVIAGVVHYVVPGTNIFTYYSRDFSGTQDPLSQPVSISDVRLIKTTLTVDKDSAQVPSATTLSLMATIRNLRGEI